MILSGVGLVQVITLGTPAEQLISNLDNAIGTCSIAIALGLVFTPLLPITLTRLSSFATST